MSFSHPLDPGALKYDADGLIPAVVQQHDTGEVLQLGYMNREAVARTLASGEVWYYSRSRQAMWHKGETSGHVQVVVEISPDCDGDALLIKADQRGAGACHTGHRSCFHQPHAPGGEARPGPAPVFDPARVYGGGAAAKKTGAPAGGAAAEGPAAGGPAPVGDRPRAERPAETRHNEVRYHEGASAAGERFEDAAAGAIWHHLTGVIAERKAQPKAGSYTQYLFESGLNKILKKVGEEATEVIVAAKDPAAEDLVYEGADLLYHLVVLLVERGIEPDALLAELQRRK
ncbi:MAG TPA: phosphoribosyl-AMP cyclohydrolase [Limnochordia bacterium]|nr:phosphoribosyl-AMP cyclohydrolase [Limnochordia bacterium]